jgi:alanine racemase
MSSSLHPNWIEVNLSAIENNVRYIVQTFKKPLMAVVKGNAYGHGSVEVGKAALSAGASWLAVARYGEARVLRQAGIQAPLLVLGMTTADEIDEAIANQVSLTLHSYESADLFSQRAQAAGKPVKAHLKLDTGMGRLGVLYNEALPFAQYVKGKPGIDVEGMYSHFANATMKDDPHTRLQTDRFKAAVETLTAEGLRPKWVHLANSCGTYFNPDSHFDMVRGGSSVMGMVLRDDEPIPSSMRPAFTWKCLLTVSKVLPAGFGIGYGQPYTTPTVETIGVIPLGYGDGYRRGKGNFVLIDGQRVPVVARECMDQTMVRLPRKYPMGTEVVIIGKQGNENITVEEIAQRWGAVEVDVTTRISWRVPRIYVRD